MAITSTTHPSDGSGGHGKTIGVAVGITIGVVAVIIAIASFFFIRRHNKREAEAVKLNRDDPSEKIRQGFAKGELGTGHDNERYEMVGSVSKSGKDKPLPTWVDEKARHPGERSHLVEADTQGTAIAEMGGTRTYVRPVHEMYDPSSNQARYELSAEQPRELLGSSPTSSTPNSPATFGRRSRGFRSPLGRVSSPSVSQPSSSQPSPRRHQTPPSQSSLVNPFRRSRLSAGPPPSSNYSSEGRYMDIPVSSSKGPFSPVSRRGTFERAATPSSPNDLRSPISPQSDSEHSGGMFDRLRRRSDR